MIRGLILYYLNIKPTHGYEIQKFIQLSGIDQWTKIQSGSIYYALTKLEKEKSIEVEKEERTGARVRKIYRITEQGKQILHKEMRESLKEPISSIGSMKFITEPMLSTLEKEEIQEILTGCIRELEEQQEFWKYWEQAKGVKEANGLAKICFEMTLQSIGYQIGWHKELLHHIDHYKQESKSMELMIRSFDFNTFEGKEEEVTVKKELEFAERLKEEMLKNPEYAMRNLDKIIDTLKEQV